MRLPLRMKAQPAPLFAWVALCKVNSTHLRLRAKASLP